MCVLAQRNGDRATNYDPKTESDSEKSWKMIDICDIRTYILSWKNDPYR